MKRRRQAWLRAIRHVTADDAAELFLELDDEIQHDRDRIAWLESQVDRFETLYAVLVKRLRRVEEKPSSPFDLTGDDVPVSGSLLDAACGFAVTLGDDAEPD